MPSRDCKRARKSARECGHTNAQQLELDSEFGNPRNKLRSASEREAEAEDRLVRGRVKVSDSDLLSGSRREREMFVKREAASGDARR